MASFKAIIFAMGLTMLFAILVIGAVVYEGNLYSKDISDVSGGSLNYSKFNNSISSLSSSSDRIYSIFNGQNSFIAVTEIIITGMFDIFMQIASLTTAPLFIITDLLVNTLQIPVVVVGVIYSLFIIGLIFAIYEAIKTGRND